MGGRVVRGTAVIGHGDRVNGGDDFAIGEILRETVGQGKVPNDGAIVGAGLR